MASQGVYAAVNAIPSAEWMVAANACIVVMHVRFTHVKPILLNMCCVEIFQRVQFKPNRLLQH